LSALQRVLIAVTRLKKFLTHLHSSEPATREFERIRGNNQQRGKDIPTPTELRWDTHLASIEVALTCQLSINDTVNRFRTWDPKKSWDEMDPTAEDWVLLAEIVPALKVMHRLTLAFEGEKRVMISRARAAVQKCRSDLKDLLAKQPNRSTAVSKMIERMIGKLDRRFSKWTPAVRLSELLDPGIRDRFKSEAEAKEDWALLQKKYEDLVKLSGPAAVDQAPTKTSDTKTGETKKSTPEDDFWTDLLGPAKRDLEKIVIHDEVERFKRLHPIDPNHDPLAWWRIHAGEFPMLAILARRYLCMMPSSAPVERVFSAAGNIFSKRRPNLSSAALEAQVLLHDNRDMLEYKRIVPAGEKEPYPLHKPKCALLIIRFDVIYCAFQFCRQQAAEGKQSQSQSSGQTKPMEIDSKAEK
jgi:hAT family C-terminal dimerisation region